jgi:hypothetical protein
MDFNSAVCAKCGKDDTQIKYMIATMFDVRIPEEVKSQQQEILQDLNS